MQLRGLAGACDCNTNVNGLGLIDKTKIIQAAKNPFPIVAAFATGVVSNVIANKISDYISKPKTGNVSGFIPSSGISDMKFNTIGLQGKFRKLIGDPEEGFSMLFYGLPKSGKSTIALEFAKELAEKHGKVLFVAIEEKFGYTLQEKLQRVNAIHPNLFISETIPDDLSSFDFVFIDSISRAGLTDSNLESMKAKYPKTAFVFIFHSTKGGNYRGTQTFAHNQDVIVEVNAGIAKAKGRFAPENEVIFFNYE